MCGIAGMINMKFNNVLIEEMLRSMNKRGPDDQGLLIDENACLLHRRLSIIDPENGWQPMSYTSAGETYTIVYNGELYNSQELRCSLVALGHHFHTNSDTEVLLHAYAQWFEKSLDLLNGIYGFAIWEHRRKRLFIARDRMGVKPFFYSLKDDGIIFASELKTILLHPEIPAEIDEEGIADLLLIGPGRIPGGGVFKNIFELKPGHCGYYEKSKLQLWQYWKLTDREHLETFEETSEHVQALVVDAIKRQMVSDVPFGTFLSGGLDSSIITSVCAKEFEKHNKRLPTFSVGYIDNEKYFVPGKFQPNSDDFYIAIMSEYLKTDHHNILLDASTLFDQLEASTNARDLPGMADVDTSLLCFCKEIRKDVKMALSGECADEIFGGYPWYRDPEIRAKEGFPWSQNAAYRGSFLHAGLVSDKILCDYVTDHYNQTIAECDILPGTSATDRRMKEMTNLNIRWFMQTLLDRKDRMSMYQSLEVRVPFCDHKIAEYMYGVPWEFKDYQGREKGLLRHAMQGYLPQEVLYRKKSPYPKTFDPKYLTLVSEALEKVIGDHTEPIHQLVDKDKMKDLLENEHPWPWYGQLMMKPQTIAYMLQLNQWLKKYNVKISI